jgi:hypothetical protein
MATNPILTLNQIVSNLRSIATEHRQLHGFQFGELPDLYTSGVSNPAELWVQIDSVNRTRSTSKFNFTFWIVDTVRRGQENQTEIQSDTAQIGEDIIAQLRHPDYAWSVINVNDDDDIQMQFFNELTPERYFGVTFKVSIQLTKPDDRCYSIYQSTIFKSIE